MREPHTTGEAIQVVRRALYELARRPSWNPRGATREEIVAYTVQKKRPVPWREFDKVIGRLREALAVESTEVQLLGAAYGRSETRYRLTAKGDLEEELARMSWLAGAWAELRRPTIVVGFVLGISATLLTQLLLKWL